MDNIYCVCLANNGVLNNHTFRQPERSFYENKHRMIKYWILGANGQIGHQLQAQLSQFPHVQCLASTQQQIDIKDKIKVFDIAHTFKPHIIINAAAYTAVDQAENQRDLAFAVNHLGAENLAQAAQAINAAIIQLSTDYVFDGKRKISYRETDITAPQNVYGASKLAGEIAVQAACMRHIVLRTSWVFGEHGNNFVKTMLRLGATYPRINVVGDQFGGPTYAGDIAAALHHIAEKVVLEQFNDYGVYHFSGCPNVSWYDFASEIFSQAQQQNVLANIPQLNSITAADYAAPAQRPANSCLDNSKIQKTFGIKPSDWRNALLNLKKYTN